MKSRSTGSGILPLLSLTLLLSGAATAQIARDPGVRPGAGADGEPIGGRVNPTLTAGQLEFFDEGREDFSEQEGVPDGLGPRFNLDGCLGCHSQPAVGGTSPPVNPQVAVATLNGARNTVPSFITIDGPVREARFVRNPDGSPDGGVHGLFVISGRSDGAAGCNIVQDNFAAQVASRNVIFRIPTPLFGAGLIEQIPDEQITAAIAATAGARRPLGIFGHFNRVSATPNNNGNDGTIARFGWKAQNKSLLLFSGEAYNVEMGITNELFQTERDETAACQFAELPNDVTNTEDGEGVEVVSAIEKFAFFMRFLAPPPPSTTVPGGTASIDRGRQRFMDVGCHLCHTPSFTTGNSTVAALRNQPVNLYSDLALHAMGPGLADGVSQEQAGPDEFRTAPLWGVGQRVFFLHDGRTSDLRVAIQAHASGGGFPYGPSEANAVIARFNALSEPGKQDLLNFLRSL